MKTQYLLVILLFTLSACGFHLRGSQQRAAAIVVSKVYVVNAGASTVTPIVKSQLAGAGATAAKSAARADYTLTLEREYFEQTVLSVSATTGKVEEYQVTLTLYMSVVDAKGVELLAGEPIRSVRDYTFDEDAVLGKFAEEQVLREELSRQAAAEILRRFNTATSSSK